MRPMIHFHNERRRLARGGVTVLAAMAAFSVMIAALLWPYGLAWAQGSPTGVIPLDTVSDFSGACPVLPGVAAQPGLTDAIVSSANGGEIRLRATVEDYFDGSQIDATQWITGYSNPSYQYEAPIVGSGVLTLYGSYLRSQTVLTETTSPRFFEARAQFVGGGLPSPTNGDIGFYRAYPPLMLPPGDQSSIRLFVSQPFHSVNNRLMYVRSRDGTDEPIVDTLVDNWGDDETAERAGLAQYRNYRINWGATETWYLIDGSAIITAGVNPLPHTGVTTRTTYVFLYNQDPESHSPDPLLIDWVRAGAYPASGVYTSCVQDAGQIANWSQVTITATLPVSASAALETRTSADGVTWSAWSAASGAIISGTTTLTPGSPSGRYLQYRLALGSSDPLNSPEVAALTFSYFGPASLVVAPAAATLNPGAAQQFAATVRDGNNQIVSGAPVTWAAVNGGGAIDASGLFTAGLPAGVFTDTVLATTSNSVTDTATVTVLDLPPVADAGGPYSGQEGAPVALDASNSSDPNGGALTYAWDLDNDGQFDDAAGVAPSASWGDEGVYTVGVLVTDIGNLTDTATTTVTIANVAPQITAVTNTSPVRRGQPVTVTVSAGDVPADPLSYSFDWTSDGTFDVTDQAGNSAATGYASTGVYTATVRVRDGDGGEATATTVITVTPQLLSATATNTSPVRRGQPVTVTVSAGQELSDVLSYGFDFDNNNTFEVVQPGASAATSYASTGVKTVNFGVADSDGGIVTSATTITVTPQILTIVGLSNSGPVLRNQPVTVIVTATQELSDPLTYSFDWENDGVYDVVDQAATSATTSYPTIGARTVRVRVRDSDGGEISGVTTVEVGAQIIQITAVNSNAPVRRNQPVTVTVTAVQQLSDVLLYSFDWNNDNVYDVVDQTANSAATSYATTGNKTIRVRVRDQQNSVASQTATLQIVAQNLTISSVANSGPVRRGQSVQVTVNAVQELSDALLYSFDWDNNGVYEIVNQASASAATSYATTGSKTVGVRVVDADGGVATGVTTITVTPQTLTLTAVTNSGPVQVGASVQVTVEVTQELGDALLYSFDWDNNGVYEIENQPASSATTSYAEAGLKAAAVRVIDADGGVVTGTTLIEVTTVEGGGELEHVYMPIINR